MTALWQAFVNLLPIIIVAGAIAGAALAVAFFDTATPRKENHDVPQGR